MRKTLAFLLAWIMLAGCCGALAETAAVSTLGFGGTVEVTVTLENGAIVDVQAVGPDETNGVGSIALDSLPKAIVEKNSLDVDTITGATVTSTAILTAAQKAVDQLNGLVSEEKPMTPGTYTADAHGLYSDIRATVVVDETSILDITVGDTVKFENTSTNTAKDGIATEVFNDGTMGFGSVANVKMPAAMVEAQSVAVDIISGATASSAAIREAVTNCLHQAGAGERFFVPPVKPEHTEETLNTDVLVVGSGIAGMSAAVTALENGAENVLMIEKLSIYGGTSISSGGAMMAVGGPDNPDAAAQDLANFWFMRAEGKADYALQLYVAQRSGEAIRDVVDMGVQFKLGSVPASDVNRSYRPKSGMCYAIIEAIRTRIDELGGTIMLDTAATHLIQDETGKVCGVLAEGKTTSYTIYADSVILATGGYEHDQSMVEKYAPVYAQNNTSGANAGDDGDAIRMCEEIGTAFSFSGYAMDDSGYAVVVTNPVDRNGGGIQYIGYTTIEVDSNTGKRFHNERSNYETAEMDDTGNFNGIYAIFDSTRPADMLEQFEEGIRNGYIFKADSFEELAEKVGMPKDAFVETMNRWNAMAEAGVDTEYGNPTIAGEAVLQAPFYAGLYKQNMIGTFGGPKINTKAEVLYPDGTPVRGLYAAGECANGDFFNRLYTCGGSSVMFGYVMGKTAGEQAAGNLK